MSSSIIRIQNLPLSAKAADIQQFFGTIEVTILKILKNIQKDAFISIKEEDEAKALLLDERVLHNSKIRLMLSSKKEMEQVISSAQAYATKGPIQMNHNENRNNQNTSSPTHSQRPQDNQWILISHGSQWAFDFFPVPGRSDMGIALSYKNTVPVHGYVWKDADVANASFPFGGKELSGAEMDGRIQVLQYIGYHNSLGFFFKWIEFKDRNENLDEEESVQCGRSAPILWTNRSGVPLPGNLDIYDEVATFALNGTTWRFNGDKISKMKILVRKIRGGPSLCPCTGCSAPRFRTEQKQHQNT
ncbi:hypothetical protein ACQ4LE_004689 [Meloidogyne hapla]